MSIRLTREEQSEAHCRAIAGDRESLDLLAASCAALIRRQARRLGRKLRIDPDDLESEGQSTFLACVKSYRPESGSFLNYYATASARAMAAYSRRLLKVRDHRVRNDDAVLNAEESPVEAEQLEGDPYAGLSPVEIALVRAARTSDDPELKRAAERIGIRKTRARAMFEEATKKAFRNILGD